MDPCSVVIASDHAGKDLKRALDDRLVRYGYSALSLEEEADYPDSAFQVTQKILGGRVERGVLICGTGIGISIAANRWSGIRAGVCHDVTSTRLARQHNNINVLALGARLIGLEIAWDCVRTFLETPSSQEERHLRRIQKIEKNPLSIKIRLTSCLSLIPLL